MFQVDRVQLYTQKASDIWIMIIILLDLPPEICYKKCFVILCAVIPGPKKLKNLDSFIFPVLHHIAALQKDGLAIWNPLNNTVFISCIWIHFARGDGPGSAQVSRFVTHNGACGCRQRCNIIGWHKPGHSMYYPVLLKLNSYYVEFCDHKDFDCAAIILGTPE